MHWSSWSGQGLILESTLAGEEKPARFSTSVMSEQVTRLRGRDEAGD
jgi:hypothetical protein